MGGSNWYLGRNDWLTWNTSWATLRLVGKSGGNAKVVTKLKNKLKY